MVKEPLAELRVAIFKNWVDTRLKMETLEPRVSPTILGVFHEVFGVRSKIWALKVPFFGTRKRALLPNQNQMKGFAGSRKLKIEAQIYDESLALSTRAENEQSNQVDKS